MRTVTKKTVRKVKDNLRDSYEPIQTSGMASSQQQVAVAEAKLEQVKQQLAQHDEELRLLNVENDSL